MLHLSSILKAPVVRNLPCTLIVPLLMQSNNLSEINTINLIIVYVLINVYNFTVSGNIFCKTRLGFQFFINYSDIYSYDILFVKGFCCLHKTKFPVFIHKLN